MQIIKVDAIDSTNTFLKNGLRNKTISKPTCVWAKNQTKGRGQQGAVWHSEPGKNLTFSVFFPVAKKKIVQPFCINILTTVCLYKTLFKFQLPNLKIKWPNDILSANNKIGGILIENNFQNGVLTGAIIGIGLNVNQVSFNNLPRASSLKKILDKEISLEELLKVILIDLSEGIREYEPDNFLHMKQEFETILFRNKKPSTFSVKGSFFTGIIQGVTNEGKLIVLQEDDVVNQYDFKEITLKY